MDALNILPIELIRLINRHMKSADILSLYMATLSSPGVERSTREILYSILENKYHAKKIKATKCPIGPLSLAIFTSFGYENWDSYMIRASEVGDIKMVKEMISRKAATYYLSISSAAKAGHHRIVKMLIENFSTPMNKTYYSHYAQQCCIGGNLRTLKFILKKRGSGNHVIWSCLQKASEYGHLDIVDYLLENKTYGNDYGKCILLASKNGHIEVVERMMSLGASNFSDCLSKAASGGHIKIVKMMAKKEGVDIGDAMAVASSFGRLNVIKYLDQKGEYDTNLCMIEAAGDGHANVVEFMLSKGADNLNECMELASETGSLEVVELLFKHGADNIEESIEIACSNGHTDIIKFFLSNAKPSNTNELMAIICSGENLDIVNLLLEHGADNYDECMEIAAGNDCYDIVELMLERGADNYDDCIVAASQINSIEIIKLILSGMKNKRIENVETYNICMLSMLQSSQHRGLGLSIDNIKFMLSMGANNYNECMEYASYRGCYELVKLFLESGADDYNNCVKISTQHGHSKIALLIINYTEDKSIYDFNDIMRMALRIKYQSAKIISALISLGANNFNECMLIETKKNNSGMNKNVDVLKLLISSGANNFNECMLIATRRNNLHLVKLFLSHGATNKEECLSIATDKSVKKVLAR